MSQWAKIGAIGLVSKGKLLLIKVKVYPNSRKEEVLKHSEDRYEVWVRARAEKKAANEEVIELLTNYFALPPGQIRIIKGFKSRSKILEVRI